MIIPMNGLEFPLKLFSKINFDTQIDVPNRERSFILPTNHQINLIKLSDGVILLYKTNVK